MSHTCVGVMSRTDMVQSSSVILLIHECDNHHECDITHSWVRDYECDISDWVWDYWLSVILLIECEITDWVWYYWLSVILVIECDITDWVWYYSFMSAVGMILLIHECASRYGPCHTYEGVMCYTWMSACVHECVCASHSWVGVTLFEPIRTMSHIWRCHVLHMNESCPTHENKSCHPHEWVISHIRMSHVIHMKESYHMPFNESCHTLSAPAQKVQK